MTSGVRRFTFSRALVPLEIRFVLKMVSACWARRLFEKRAAWFLESCVCDHDSWVGIRRTRVVHPLDFGSDGAVFRLGGCDVDWGPVVYERKEFCCCFALQPNATVITRHGVNKPLMKAIAGSEVA